MKVPERVEVLSTTVSWPMLYNEKRVGTLGPRATGQPIVTCTCWPAPQVYAVGDRVLLDVPAGEVSIGKCIKANVDGTIEVRLDQKPKPILDGIRDKVNMAAIGDNGFTWTGSDDKPPSDDKPLCPECGGSGVWINPAGGRNPESPCSKGCPKP